MKPETLQAIRWFGEGKKIQHKHRDTPNIESEEWVDVEAQHEESVIAFSDYVEYRLKPRTIMIGDMEVPAPETEVPARGTKYYTPYITTGYKEAHITSIWGGTPLDESRLEHGLVHLSWQNAGAHTKALIKISGGTV